MSLTKKQHTSRPDHWQVIKWIYEKYNYWIHVSFVNTFYSFNIRGFNSNTQDTKKIMSNTFHFNSKIWGTQYEAIEEAIEYFINNIEFYTNVTK